ncbi:MAG TPA: NlpC/P60 family protein [Rhizomicrobium sp.]
MSDPRLTPARPDLAAAYLRGKVEAARFAEGKIFTVTRGRAPLRGEPRSDASLTTELLFGEAFTVYETREGWAWGQAQKDSYVGYLSADALGDVGSATHRVTALMTPLLPAPDLKRIALDMLPLNAGVKIVSSEKNYARLAGGGFVTERHLAPLDALAPDWTATAERFLGVPYIWGGKTQAGLDCSGLIQTALAASGIVVPRDTDLIENFLTHESKSPARGDLVFWKGHMGVMLDASRLLHANAFHMQVAIEPLAEAIARIEKSAGPVTSVKRI